MIPIDDLNPAERALHAELSKMTDADLDRWATTPIGFDPNVRRALVLLRVRRERDAPRSVPLTDADITRLVYALKRAIEFESSMLETHAELKLPRERTRAVADEIAALQRLRASLGALLGRTS